MKGYTVLRKDLVSETVAHGGVMIAVHHSVPSRHLCIRTPLQAVAVRATLGQRELTVCSIYCPPGVPLPHVEMRQLMRELPSPVLLLGDFNSHHPAWGSTSECARGRLLASFLDDEGLCVLNTGSPTHLTLPSGHTSVLDLSLCSPELAHLFSWEADSDPQGSDHFPVWVNYLEQPRLGSRPPRWNLRKADWDQFSSRLEDAFPPEEAENLSVDEFTFRLLQSAEGCIPRSKGNPKRIPVPW